MKRKKIDSLAFYPTPDIVEEIIHRKTFVGVVIHSEQEQKFSGQVHDKFKVFSSLNRENLIEFLEKVLCNLKTQK